MGAEPISFRKQLEAMIRGEVPPPPVSRLLGLRLVSAAEGEAVFELEVVPEHANPMGTLQGGVICALADAAMGMAYASRLEDGESFTTLELKANFVRAVREGVLRCEARAVHLGRTTHVWDANVTGDGDERPVALFRCTQLVLYPS